MSYYLSDTLMDEALQKLSKSYRIFAPKRVGRYIRYGEVASLADIVFDEKSHFSTKEVYYPIVQTLLYFTENECRENEPADLTDLLLFARACDINAIDRLDTMFLRNGGQADNFYEQQRKRVKCILMECEEGFDTCFCVSMGSNTTDNYIGAIRRELGGVRVLVRNPVQEPELSKAFLAGEPCDFLPEFVHENKKTVRVPDIDDRSLLKPICELEYWRSFDEKCVSCGGCNTVCPTCSCFDTADVIYDETSRDGERRRIWSSCMLDDFTTMAGGHRVRSLPGDKMRFKTLHKVYDFKARFGGENMCVGCGRCDMRCPKDIHFSQTVDMLAAEVERLKEEVKENA